MELLGGKEKFELMLKRVDGRLGLLMGLGQGSAKSNYSRKVEGVLTRPLEVEKVVGFGKGPIKVFAK